MHSGREDASQRRGKKKGEKGWKGRFGWEQVAPTTSRGRIVGSAHAPCFHTAELSRAEQSRCRAREETVGEIGTFLKTPLNLWASQTCYYPVDILYIEMWHKETHPWQRYGFEGRKRKQLARLVQGQSSTCGVRFRVPDPQTDCCTGSKTNPRIGGASVLLKLEAHLCQSIVCATDTPCPAVFQSLPGSP